MKNTLRILILLGLVQTVLLVVVVWSMLSRPTGIAASLPAPEKIADSNGAGQRENQPSARSSGSTEDRIVGSVLSQKVAAQPVVSSPAWSPPALPRELAEQADVVPTPQSPDTVVALVGPVTPVERVDSDGSRLEVAPASRRQTNGRPDTTSQAGRLPGGVISSSLGRGEAESASVEPITRQPASADVAELSDEVTVDVPEGATVPVALEEPDESIVADPRKRDQLKKIQDRFADSIRDEAGQVSDAVPRPKWQTAQWLADQEYRAMFGQQAFNDQQRKAAAALGE